jgi:hypothetical protein
MANTITATFGLNLAPLKAAAASASAIAVSLSKSFASAGKSVGGALTGPLKSAGAGFAKLLSPIALATGAMIAFFSISNFKSQLTGIFDLGLELKKMSAQTGISVGTLVSMQGALKNAGIDAAALGTHVNKMQKFLTGAGGKTQITALGLDFEKIRASSPDDQFIAIGKAIGAVKDPAERATAALKIFGKGGGALLPLFTDQDFGSGKLSNAAKVLDKNADTFAKVSVLLSQTGKPLKGFFIGVAASIAGSFIPLLKAFNSIDLVKIGVIFGAGMIAAADAFKGAFADPETAMDVLTNGLIAGFLTAGNYLIGIFEFLGKLLSDKEFWGGLINVFLGLEMIISGALMKGFNTPLKFFQDSMQFIVEKTLAGLDKLNPFSTKKDEIKEQQNLLTKYTDELNGKKGGTFRTGGQGPDVVIPDIVAATDPRRIKQLKNYIAGAEVQIQTLTEGRSFAGIQAANKGEELTVGGKTPDELIAEGRAKAGKGGKDIFTAAIAKFKDTKVTDALGAGAYAAKAAAGFEKLRAQGAEMMGPAAPVAAAAAKAVDKSPFQFGENRLSGETMDAGTFTRGLFQGADARMRGKESRGMNRFLFGLTGLDKGASSRGGKRLEGLTTKSLDGAGTGLKPLITETPATPADDAAIKTAFTSQKLLDAFKELAATWKH